MNWLLRLVVDEEVSASRDRFRARLESLLQRLKAEGVTARRPFDEQADHVKRVRWMFRKGNNVELVWIDDAMVQVRYFELMFFAENKLEELKSALAQEFRMVEADQALTLHDAAPSGRTLARASLNGGNMPDARIVAALIDALRSRSNELRKCAAYLSSVLRWPELYRSLEAAAEKEPPGDTEAWMRKAMELIGD